MRRKFTFSLARTIAKIKEVLPTKMVWTRNFVARYSEFYFETEVELWRSSWQTASLIFKQTRKQLKNQFSLLARNTSKNKLSTKRFANYSLPKKSKLDFERYSRQNEANSEHSHSKNETKSVYILCRLQGLRTLPQYFQNSTKDSTS